MLSRSVNATIGDKRRQHTRDVMSLEDSGGFNQNHLPLKALSNLSKSGQLCTIAHQQMRYLAYTKRSDMKRAYKFGKWHRIHKVQSLNSPDRSGAMLRFTTIHLPAVLSEQDS